METLALGLLLTAAAATDLPSVRYFCSETGELAIRIEKESNTFTLYSLDGLSHEFDQSRLRKVWLVNGHSPVDGYDTLIFKGVEFWEGACRDLG